MNDNEILDALFAQRAANASKTYTQEELTVYLNDKPVVRLNGRLADKQKITPDQLERLKELHVQRILIEQQLDQAHRPEDISHLFEDWTEVQYLLQMNWNFPMDKNFHPSHRLAPCLCAKLDNDERLGTKFRVITSGCPIHDPI